MALKGDDSKFSIATTVTLALAVAALVLVKEPLKSSRPAGAGMELSGASEELKVRAKLWEDPFAAVQKDAESRKKSAMPGGSSASTLNLFITFLKATCRTNRSSMVCAWRRPRLTPLERRRRLALRRLLWSF